MMTAERTAPKPDNIRIGEILDRLDGLASSSAPSAGGERRKPYRKAKPMATIDHPAGGTARLVAHSRLLWSEGMILLAAGFTYPGSMFTGTLVSGDGESLGVRGRVVDCRHIEGVYHELEVKFSSRVDVSLFIDTGSDPSGRSLAVDLPNLQGHVLYLDDSDLDARLLAHHMKGSGVKLKCVRTAAEALALLKAEMFDIFVSDLNLAGGEEGMVAIRAARAAGFSGPTVLLTAETSDAKLTAVRAEGVDLVLAKPYQRNTLIQAMVTLHQKAGAVGAGEVLYSTIGDQPETDELLSSYVADVRALAQQLQQGIIANDYAAVRHICLNVRGSASGYGFPTLGTAAEEAVRLLDGGLEIAPARPKIRTLLLLCDQLGVRKRPAPPKPDGDRLV